MADFTIMAEVTVMIGTKWTIQPKILSDTLEKDLSHVQFS
jgi:hypothetical protein